MNPIQIALLIAVLSCCVFLDTACRGSGSAAGDTPEAAYEHGMKYFQEQRYHKAIDSFQRVFEFGRASEWADDAQYMLARSYFENEQYLLSANEFDRFIGLYPSDDHIEDAAYYRAMSYYELSPAYNLDPTDTKKAIDYLRLFLAAYPNSEHRDDIGKKVDELQAKLANKLMETGRLYERNGYYRAAVLTYQRVLDEYPSTKPVDEALLGAIRAQIAYADASVLTKREERLNEAIDMYNRMYQLFPNSPYMKDAEALYAEIQEKLEALIEG